MLTSKKRLKLEQDTRDNCQTNNLNCAFIGNNHGHRVNQIYSLDDRRHLLGLGNQAVVLVETEKGISKTPTTREGLGATQNGNNLCTLSTEIQVHTVHPRLAPWWQGSRWRRMLLLRKFLLRGMCIAESAWWTLRQTIRLCFRQIKGLAWQRW